ncbi:MAG: hypothetical protein FWG43_01635, partial [Clostridiales bacterium]|nr:hypothetical protein [Clostridiales bacterium]
MSNNTQFTPRCFIPLLLCLIATICLFSSHEAIADDSITFRESLLKHNFDQNTINQEIFIWRDHDIERTIDSSLSHQEIQDFGLMDIPPTHDEMLPPIMTIDDLDCDPILDALYGQRQQNMAMMAATPSFTLVSMTATSVTVNAVFPTSGAKGNVFAIRDYNQSTTTYTAPYGGSSQIYRTNGNFTYTGLVPGGFYFLHLLWSTDGGITYGGSNILRLRIQLPYNTTEVLTRSDGTNVYSNIETADKNLATAPNFSTWLNRMDSAYLAYKDLTGYAPYAKIGLQSTRIDLSAGIPINDSTFILGTSGNPAIIGRPFYRAHM